MGEGLLRHKFGNKYVLNSQFDLKICLGKKKRLDLDTRERYIMEKKITQQGVEHHT